jgi:hypothetical protein
MKNEITIQSKIFGIFTILFFFTGFFACVFSINKIQNYYHPYRFCFLIAILGFALGMLLTHYIKPFLKLNLYQYNRYYNSRLFVSLGFTGIFIFVGAIINSELSKKVICDNFIVKEKTN